jgi:dienelactone hydrolase
LQQFGVVLIPPVIGHSSASDELQTRLRADRRFTVRRVDIFANQGLKLPRNFPFNLFGPKEAQKMAAFVQSLDVDRILAEIDAQVRSLTDAGCTQIFLVGWSIGAAYALMYAQNNPVVTGIVGISPMLKPPGSLAAHMPKPNLISVPQCYVYGLKDKKVPTMKQDVEAWKADSTVSVETHTVQGDHPFDIKKIGWMPNFTHKKVSKEIAHGLVSRWVAKVATTTTRIPVTPSAN